MMNVKRRSTAGALDLSATEGLDGLAGTALASVGSHEVEIEKTTGLLRRLFRHPHVIIGNGADEFIDLACLRLLISHGKGKVCVLTPTYGRYAQAAARHGHTCVEIERARAKKGGILRPVGQDTIVSRIIQEKPDITFLPNPGNPTPDFFDRKNILRIADAASPGLLMVDEAYIDYAITDEGASSVTLLKKRKNICVIRSFSKAFGLYGLRVGAMLCHESMLQGYLDCKRRDTVGTPSLKALRKAIDGIDLKKFRLELRRTLGSRKRAFMRHPAIRQQKGRIWDGRTNFLLISAKHGLCGTIIGKDVTKKIRQGSGRYFRVTVPKIPTCQTHVQHA